MASRDIMACTRFQCVCVYARALKMIHQILIIDEIAFLHCFQRINLETMFQFTTVIQIIITDEHSPNTLYKYTLSHISDVLCSIFYSLQIFACSFTFADNSSLNHIIKFVYFCLHSLNENPFTNISIVLNGEFEMVIIGRFT